MLVEGLCELQGLPEAFGLSNLRRVLEEKVSIL